MIEAKELVAALDQLVAPLFRESMERAGTMKHSEPGGRSTVYWINF